MPTITVSDGTSIYYKDWGTGQPVVFSHGWPLNADAWDDQMYFLAANGFRVIAHDRRGHGRSTQTFYGADMNTYADDLAAVVDALDLQGAIHIAHSTGGGELVRYLSRHGTHRVSKVVLVSAIPPFLLRTPDNPEGIPLTEFDTIRARILTDRAQFWKTLAPMFYGANRPGSKVSQGALDAFWLWGMQVGLPAAHDCVNAIAETDFRPDLAKIDVPTLIIHGDDDQIVPFAVAGQRSAREICGAILKVYEGAPHGLMVTHQERLNADLLEFSRLESRAVAA